MQTRIQVIELERGKGQSKVIWERFPHKEQRLIQVSVIGVLKEFVLKASYIYWSVKLF